MLLGIVVGFYELAKTVWHAMKPVCVDGRRAACCRGCWRPRSLGRDGRGDVLLRDARSARRGRGDAGCWRSGRTGAIPERLTAVMIAAFAGKMVFFGAYVAVDAAGAVAAPVPFVVSFTGYFIALYLIEALCLRRLFAGGARVRLAVDGS